MILEPTISRTAPSPLPLKRESGPPTCAFALDMTTHSLTHLVWGATARSYLSGRGTSRLVSPKGVPIWPGSPATAHLYHPHVSYLMHIYYVEVMGDESDRTSNLSQLASSPREKAHTSKILQKTAYSSQVRQAKQRKSAEQVDYIRSYVDIPGIDDHEPRPEALPAPLRPKRLPPYLRSDSIPPHAEAREKKHRT